MIVYPTSFVNTSVKKCLKILTKDIVQTVTNYSYRCYFDSLSNARCSSSPRQIFSGSLNSAHCRTVTFKARSTFFKVITPECVCVRGPGAWCRGDSSVRTGRAPSPVERTPHTLRSVFARHRIGARCIGCIATHDPCFNLTYYKIILY